MFGIPTFGNNGGQSGMAQLIMDMIPDDLKIAIEKAKTDIPAFAVAMENRIKKMEAQLTRIENICVSLDDTVSRVLSRVDPDYVPPVPPTLQAILQIDEQSTERSF